jgi:uncharacterized protein YacL
MDPLLGIVAGATIINTAISAAVLARSIQKRPLINNPKETGIIIDTCALIDGRLLEIVKSGFVPERLLIPQAVVAELQYLADQADPLKRERARFGLDVVRELQDTQGERVVILPTPGNTKLVDELLIDLAAKHNASLYTTDYNLNKVADIRGVKVLNVNELAQGLRARFLPGETMAIKLVQKGQDGSQGVGFLDDGTMVVVERAGSKIGQVVNVTFSRVLQTQAGKMMFAQLRGESKDDQKNPRRKAAPFEPKPTTPRENHQKPQQRTQRSQSQRRKSPEDTLIESLNKYS